MEDVIWHPPFLYFVFVTFCIHISCIYEYERRTHMNYEMFKRKVKDEILQYLPEEFKNLTVRINTVNKINRQEDKISIVTEYGIGPSLCLQDLYLDYLGSMEIHDMLQRIADIFVNMINGFPEKESFSSKNIMDKVLSDFTNLIFIKLVNYEANKSLLNNCPHRKFLDLAVMYCIELEMDDQHMGIINVDNRLLEQYNKLYQGQKTPINESELYDIALTNSRKRHPFLALCPDNMFLSFYHEILFEDFEFDSYREHMKKIGFFLTNIQKNFGAIVLLYPDIIKQLADYFESDFYIMPSSVHEIMLWPAGEVKPDLNMVYQMNQIAVEPEERLSNQIYFYSRKTNHIMIISNATTNIL